MNKPNDDGGSDISGWALTIVLLLIGLGISAYVYLNPGIIGFERSVIIPGQFIGGITISNLFW